VNWRMTLFISMMMLLVIIMLLQVQFVFNYVLLILLNLFVGLDIFLGGLFFLPVSVSWALVGFILGFLFYFGLRQAYRLGEPVYRRVSLGAAFGFCAILLIMGIVSAWSGLNAPHRANAPQAAQPNQQTNPATVPDSWRVSSVLGQIDWQKTFHFRDNLVLPAMTDVKEGKFVLAGDAQASIYTFLMDSTGNVSWEISYSGDSLYRTKAILRLSDGGYLLAGVISAKNDNNEDGFAARLSSSGQVMWIKRWGETKGDGFNALCLDPKGGFYLAGYSTDPDGQDRGWLLKIDGWGNVLREQFIPRDDCAFTSVIMTPEGNVLLGGRARVVGRGINFMAPAARVAYHGWVIKLTSEGNTAWERYLENLPDSEVRQIINCPEGGYAVVGISNNQNTGFFARIDENGTIRNLQNYTGPGEWGCYGITERPEGTFIVAGINSQSGDPKGDGWVASLDSTGQILKQQAFNSGSRDIFNNIQPLNGKELILSGSRTVPDTGKQEGWVMKLTLASDSVATR
jgi:hypothetical protein